MSDELKLDELTALEAYGCGYRDQAPATKMSAFFLCCFMLGLYHRENRKAPLMTSEAVVDRVLYLRRQEAGRLQSYSK